MNDKNYKLIAFTEDGLSLDVRVDAEKETVWLTQAEMAELFDIERPVVLYHLRTIYRNEELSEEATCTKIVQVQNEGGRVVKRERPIYNLDVILSVGYRVNSKRGIAFEASTYEESSVVRCEINVSPRDLWILNREYCAICSRDLCKDPPFVNLTQREENVGGKGTSAKADKTMLVEDFLAHIASSFPLLTRGL